MAYILLLLILLNSSIAIAIFFNKRIEETVFLTIFAKIVIVFVFGLLNNLKAGFYTIIFLNILLLIYNCRQLYKNPKFIKDNILTVGLVLFLITYMFFIWLNHYRMLSEWDEFSHWGTIVKNMFSLNNLAIGSDSNAAIKTYLSGIALFQYFGMMLKGSFSEPILFLCINTAMLSFILPVFSVFKKFKSVSVYTIFFVVMFFPILFYVSTYRTLYIDAILGITFACGLFNYYMNYEEGLSKFNVISLMATTTMLIFIKDFGLILAGIVLGIIAFDNLFIRNKFKFDIKEIYKNIKYIVIAVMPCILVKVIWSIALHMNQVKNPVAGQGMVSKVLSIFVPGEYRREVVINFIRAVFNEKLAQAIIDISYVKVIIIFIVLAFILIHKTTDKIKRNAYKSLSVFVILGAIGYAIALMLAYVIFFSEYEAIRLASFSRYMNTYALGMLLLVIILLIKECSNNSKSIIKFSLISFAIVMLVSNSELALALLNNRSYVNNTLSMRSSYSRLKEQTQNNIKDNEKTYFISIHDTGFDYWIARYELTPKGINDWGWSIGEGYGEEDIWTNDIAKEAWQQMLLDDYEYVYLYHVEDVFVDRYKDLFNLDHNLIMDNQLYSVNKNAENDKILELIEE